MIYSTIIGDYLAVAGDKGDARIIVLISKKQSRAYLSEFSESLEYVSRLIFGCDKISNHTKGVVAPIRSHKRTCCIGRTSISRAKQAIEDLKTRSRAAIAIVSEGLRHLTSQQPYMCVDRDPRARDPRTRRQMICEQYNHRSSQL